MRMNMLRSLAFVGLAALSLSGCGTTGEFLSGVATSVSTAAPTQASTVLEAEQAARLAEDSITLYATSGHTDKAVVHQLEVLLPPIHNTLVKVEDANRNGDNAGVAAALSVFNEAWAAYGAYATAKGVKK